MKVIFGRCLMLTESIGDFIRSVVPRENTVVTKNGDCHSDADGKIS